MNNKKKLKQFMICLCCVFCSTALTIPYLSYATTQDDLDNANRELESLKAQQQSLSADLSEIDSQLQITPLTSLLDYAFYVSFFPQLI